ncbi:hypothetical protein BKA70DRAFT_1227701 [Coprinopsis sp. MPI-PUGE-AT-0042]|nr:hypothetical protein BKA70DRAFT_1227701 [Coprinopsis sp. MPI-PUGE-AT-0042]
MRRIRSLDKTYAVKCMSKAKEGVDNAKSVSVEKITTIPELHLNRRSLVAIPSITVNYPGNDIVRASNELLIVVEDIPLTSLLKEQVFPVKDSLPDPETRDLEAAKNRKGEDGKASPEVRICDANRTWIKGAFPAPTCEVLDLSDDIFKGRHKVDSIRLGLEELCDILQADNEGFVEAEARVSAVKPSDGNSATLGASAMYKLL